jgi:hypothetical protein
LAAIIVSLSIGIVIAGVPYIPHPPGTIQQAETHEILAGTPDNASTYAVTLAGVPGGAQFAIGVSVTNGLASFCVEQQSYYLQWNFNSQFNHGLAFDYTNCILTYDPTAQATLRFTPPVTGTWNVVAINTDPNNIVVEFSPAS